MLKNTPLRLVAIEEMPPDDDHAGAPVTPITEAEAITRKVPNSEAIAAHESQAKAPTASPPWRRLVPIAAVAFVVTVAVVALALTRGRSPAKTNGPAAATTPGEMPTARPPSAAPAPIPAPSPVPAAMTPPPLTVPGAPEVIRLEIVAEPKEAELSLDGNVLAGHRLNLRVPRDRGIHVVSASAPGYIPFNQQVSFAGDVVLSINLRRGHAPAPARQPGRARASAPEAKANAEVRAQPSHPGARVEPGMNLEGPTQRAGAKSIDERNPYKP